MATTANKSTTSTAVPAILTGHALRSLRDAGFDFASAISEVIDNSIEANANEITVFLDDQADKKGKTHVERVLIADDGLGMGLGPQGEDVLHHYLQLGYSTRYMSSSTMGKYGLGAKLAAFNFAERIDVWSRHQNFDSWRHVEFDLTEAEEAERQGKPVEIPTPDDAALPEEFAEFLPEGSGTVIMWSKIDRLQAGRLAPDARQLRVELEQELSRMFREFLHGGIVISVSSNDDEKKLLPHDPLFLMDKSWADSVLTKEAKKIAKEAGEEGEKVKVKTHFPALVVADEPISVGGSKVQLRVTVFPEEVTRKRGKGGDNVAKLLRVPQNQGAISFLRLDREINYTPVPRILPGGVLDIDRFIGIEVQFTPEMDEYFGVRHVKRGVEPHGDLRDKIRERLARHIPQARKKIEEQHDAAAQRDEDAAGEHAAVTDALNETNRKLPKGKVQSEEGDDEKRDAALEELAEDIGKDTEEEKDDYVERTRKLPFVIESVSFPGQSFVDVRHFSDQIIIELNTRHRFYRELWEPIKEIAEQDPGTVSGEQAVRAARRTVEALTLLIAAYAKAESMDQDPNQYKDLRNYWGQFLDTLMGKIKNVV